MDPKPSPLLALPRYGVLALALGYLAVAVWLAAQRIPYPYELEWMEGGCVDAVARILDGKTIYPEPSTEFIPFLYTPGYFYVSALVAKLTGLGYTPLRLVAFVGVLLCMWRMWALVRRETGDGYAAALGALSFAAMYELTGSWFEVTRADSLYLFLQLIALGVLRWRHRTNGGLALAAVLFFVTFFTKQTALFVFLATAFWAVVALRKRALWFIVPFLVLLGASTAAMNWLTDGWFVYYVFVTPQTHPIWEKYMFGLFWTDDIGKPLFTAIGVAIVYLLFGREHPEQTEEPPFGGGRFFWFCAFGGLLVAGWWVRGHTGSYNNIVIPTYAGIAMGFGMGLATLLERARSGQGLLAPVAYALALFQFLWLGFDPRDNVPSEAQRNAGDDFVAALEELEGDVFVPAHPYLPTRAGKSSSSHLLSMKDCLTPQVERELLEGIEGRRWDAIVLERRWKVIDDVLEANYVERGPLIDVPLRPMTGLMPRKPPMVWVPREESR